MAMPQRDDLIDEIQKTDALLEYARTAGRPRRNTLDYGIIGLLFTKSGVFVNKKIFIIIG